MPYVPSRKRVYDDLIRWEGWRLEPYDDATGRVIRPGDALIGKITIGAGRNLTDRGITQAEGLVLLATDADIALIELDRIAPWWRQLSGGRQLALVNMIVNLGAPRLLKFRDMLAALQSGDYGQAAAEAMDSLWADQTDGKTDGKHGDRARHVAMLIREG